ncbi:MAG: DUF3362 domain-containing protein, partial [Clostridium sp.]
CMYYTGLDPRTMEPVYVAVNPHEKAMQRALIQYRNPKNYDLVAEALKIAGRTDLIGFDKKCLIKPRNFDKSAHDEKEFRGHGGVSGGKNAVGRNENSRNGNNRNTAGKNTGGRNTGASGRNMEKLSGSKMNAAKTAGKKKGIRNVHKKKLIMKIAVITGASSGMGWECAIRYGSSFQDWMRSGQWEDEKSAW